MTRILGLVVCFGLLLPSSARGQAPAPDPIRELLTEVRALRIAMERSATVGARIQLLVARVQLQEQRIAELSRRAVAVRDELSKVEASIATNTSQLKQIESAIEKMPAESRRAMGDPDEMFRQQLAASEKRRQELMDEESQLSQQIAADQGRWSDVNGQLDQLERSLALPIKQ
jgi:predicted  nucleic acid-binding Zn-ribbon protein